MSSRPAASRRCRSSWGAQTEVVVDACDEDAPDGWKVLQEASGASEFNVLCNFLVERFVEDVGQTFVSGIAITVEYFCTAAEAQESFEGKTGPRDTETSRSATKVVTEEGLAASNKDNPQPNLIFGFGPVPYELQEKAWILVNPQIVATVFVLTNERGAAKEEERFGVDAALPALITITNNHLPTTCAVPAVGGVPGAPGTAGGARAGRAASSSRVASPAPWPSAESRSGGGARTDRSSGHRPG